MKTIKLILVVAILAVAASGYAGVDPGPKYIKISLKRAMEKPELLHAMYQQLNKDFLQVDQHGYYLAEVKYDRRIYLVFGTYDEWMFFFSRELRELPARQGSNNSSEVLTER
mgnify:CR=1 FL=1